MSGTVEVDETYIGGKPRKGQVTTKKEARQWAQRKHKVVTLVERDGRARSFRAANVTAETLQGAVRRHVAPGASVMTDEHKSYKGLRRDYDHQTVTHSQSEYVRGNVTTNTVESYFATLKRGVNGTYHRISEAHLHRYLAEFDFRYNARTISDGQRTLLALQGAEGKRLKYRETC
jgi:transposase-like protein